MGIIREYEGKNILRHVSGKDYAVAVDVENAELSMNLPDPLPVTAVVTTNPLPTSENWRVSLQAEETTNDSDKTFTVPASTEWEILSIWIELTTTATPGNRQITVEIWDLGNDVIGSFLAGKVQAATLTKNYMFAPGLQLMTDFVGAYLSFPLPPMFLPAGFKVRVYDSAAIQAAADDMVVQMVVAARAV